MDAESAYAPVDLSFDAPAPTTMARGMRILLAVFGLLCVLIVVTFIMSTTNSISNASRETREKSLLQRLSVLSGLAGESTHRYRFSTVYDAVTRIPVVNPFDYFYGLPSGNAIAIVRGWIDILWDMPAVDALDSSDSGAVSYNVSVAHPNGRAVTALEIMVTSFAARSDHLVEKGSILLCGPGNQPCAALDKQGVYTGSGIITSAFARRAGAEDEMHMAYFLLIYGAPNATTPLADENVLFVVELHK
jgi:hypothetical protein